MLALRASYCHIYWASRLGYYISQKKSTLVPTQRLVHLGFGVDNSLGSFFLPERLRTKFRLSRDRLLLNRSTTLHEMQSFLGKCNNLRLVFPASSLFTIECRTLLSSLDESSSPLPPSCLEEIAFWTFPDSFTAPIPFRFHQHLSLSLSTDASGYAWGAVLHLPSGPLNLRDYWLANHLPKDICVKEALAILFALESVADSLHDRRVDVFSDNEGVVKAWSGLRSSSRDLTGVLQSLFLTCCEFNVSLKMSWVSTHVNVADEPSREVRRSDSSLSGALRTRVWRVFGPFSVDLMALPSNVMRNPEGVSLPFFAPYPARGAAGVNVFAQQRPLGLLWAFPPFNMVSALIGLLREWARSGRVEALLVLPLPSPVRPPWMNLLEPYIIDRLLLSSPSDLEVLLLPSRSGFFLNALPLGFCLSAVRCSFLSTDTSVSRPLPLRRLRLLVVSDSMLRPLQLLQWPAPFEVVVHCISGGTLRDVALDFLRLSRESSFAGCILHAGVNDVSKSSGAPPAALESASRHFVSMIAAHSIVPHIVVSTICQTRRSDINAGVFIVNASLRSAAASHGWRIASNDLIRASDLKDDVHLNAAGIARVFRTLHHALRLEFGLRVGLFF